MKIPKEPDWVEIDRVCDNCGDGSVVHRVRSLRMILRNFWNDASKGGWNKNAIKYFNIHLIQLEYILRMVKQAKTAEELQRLLLD